LTSQFRRNFIRPLILCVPFLWDFLAVVHLLSFSSFLPSFFFFFFREWLDKCLLFIGPQKKLPPPTSVSLLFQGHSLRSMQIVFPPSFFQPKPAKPRFCRMFPYLFSRLPTPPSPPRLRFIRLPHSFPFTPGGLGTFQSSGSSPFLIGRSPLVHFTSNPSRFCCSPPLIFFCMSFQLLTPNRENLVCLSLEACFGFSPYP